MLTIKYWPEDRPEEVDELTVSSPLDVKEEVLAKIGAPARVLSDGQEFRLYYDNTILKLEPISI